MRNCNCVMMKTKINSVTLCCQISWHGYCVHVRCVYLYFLPQYNPWKFWQGSALQIALTWTSFKSNYLKLLYVLSCGKILLPKSKQVLILAVYPNLCLAGLSLPKKLENILIINVLQNILDDNLETWGLKAYMEWSLCYYIYHIYWRMPCLKLHF